MGEKVSTRERILIATKHSLIIWALMVMVQLKMNCPAFKFHLKLTVYRTGRGLNLKMCPLN